MNLIIGSYLGIDSFAHFANILDELYKSGNSYLPIFDYELEEMESSIKRKHEHTFPANKFINRLISKFDVITFTDDYRKPDLLEMPDYGKIKTREIRLFLSNEFTHTKESLTELSEIITKKFIYDQVILYLNITNNNLNPEIWAPIFRICDCIDFMNTGKYVKLRDLNFEIKNSRLTEFRFISIDENTTGDILGYIPESITDVVIDVEKSEKIDYFVKILRGKLPYLKGLALNITNRLIDITYFKQLGSLILLLDCPYLKFHSGFLKNDNLTKLIISPSKDTVFTTKLKFNYPPFPDSLKILEIRGRISVDRLGYTSKSVVRFLPAGLEELVIPISGDLETGLIFENKFANLIPDVGILKLILLKNQKNTIEIPDSVYYLTLVCDDAKSNLSDCIKFGENTKIRQIDFALNHKNDSIFNILKRINFPLQVDIQVSEKIEKPMIDKSQFKNITFLS